MQNDLHGLLDRTNRLWNSLIQYKRNGAVVDAADAVRNGGDCNDYVMAKGNALVDPGLPHALPSDRLKVVIGRDKDSGDLHSILLVDPGDGSEPVALDNRPGHREVVPLSAVGAMDIYEQFDFDTFRNNRKQASK